jgi:hypothetical protein
MGANMRRELEQRIAAERSQLCHDALAGELESSIRGLAGSRLIRSC